MTDFPTASFEKLPNETTKHLRLRSSQTRRVPHSDRVEVLLVQNEQYAILMETSVTHAQILAQQLKREIKGFLRDASIGFDK